VAVISGSCTTGNGTLAVSSTGGRWPRRQSKNHQFTTFRHDFKLVFMVVTDIFAGSSNGNHSNHNTATLHGRSEHASPKTSRNLQSIYFFIS
jgi:hypothetical protein